MDSQLPAAAGTPAGVERAVLIAAILASSMAFIDSTALNVALPALQADFHLAAPDLLWVVNAYALVLAALILAGGALGDQWGRKRVFMAGIGLFALMSLACGLAPGGGWLIAARAGQGLGGALMVPGSLALIAAAFDGARRGQAIGTWGAFSTLTTILGPVLGGGLAGAGWWRAIFFINLPLAGAALALLYWRVPADAAPGPRARIDGPGAALATVALAGLTYGCTTAATAGWTALPVLVALGGGIGAGVAFVVVEARTPQPMLPLDLFRERTFSVTNLITLFLYAALGGALVFLPLNLVQVQGYPAALAGFALVPFALLLTLISRPAGRWADRVGPRPALIGGPGLVGLGFAALALPGLTAGPAAYWTSYFPAIVLLGLGMGLTVAPLTTAVMSAAGADRAGVASGVNNAVARSAGVLAVAVLGALVLIWFRDALAARTAGLDLPAAAATALQQAAAQLGNTAVPDAVAPAAHPAVAGAIRLAFIDAFRLVVACAAGLAWLSATLAALLLPRRPAK
ncbi:MAG TPA: MFS transporter [Chloroflexia bacterium]|nr:MFS transporter [Chloroflexia bacterium]